MSRQYPVFKLWFVFLPLLFSCREKTNAPSEKETSSPEESIEEGRSTEWIADPDASKVSFTILNFGKEVDGSLGGLKATIHFSEKNLKSSSFDASVEVSTIKTSNGMRDKDLMNKKYFDESNYHLITFRSDDITRSGNGYVAKGTLTIKGKSLPREIPFTFQQDGDKGIFKSDFSLKRLDYGIGGTGPIMGEEINVSLEVVTKKK